MEDAPVDVHRKAAGPQSRTLHQPRPSPSARRACRSGSGPHLPTSRRPCRTRQRRAIVRAAPRAAGPTPRAGGRGAEEGTKGGAPGGATALGVDADQPNRHRGGGGQVLGGFRRVARRSVKPAGRPRAPAAPAVARVSRAPGPAGRWRSAIVPPPAPDDARADAGGDPRAMVMGTVTAVGLFALKVRVCDHCGGSRQILGAVTEPPCGAAAPSRRSGSPSRRQVRPRPDGLSIARPGPTARSASQLRVPSRTLDPWRRSRSVG